MSKNAAMALPFIRKIRSKCVRTVRPDPREQAKQILDQFNFFMGALGSVDGKTIVEIGPGDTIALGAMFLRRGASRYIAIDRFHGDIFGPYAMAVYRELGLETGDFQDRIALCNTPIEKLCA